MALAAADLAYFTGAGLLIPVVQLFATGPLGSNELGAGVAYGAFSVSALVVRPFAGRLSDRRGRRPLLVAGGVMFAVVVAAHVVATSLPVLIGLRLLLGVAEALFFVAGFAMLADLAPPGRAGEALSFNSLALYLGIALGPSVGRFLLDAGGFTLAWLGAAALALLAALIASRVPETVSAGSRHTPPTPLIHRAAIPPSLCLFTAVAGSAGFFAFVALRAEQLGTTDWNVALLLYGLVVVGARIAFARLPDRVPPYRLGAVALALCAAGLAIAAVAPGFTGLLVATAVLALGVAFATPAFFAAIFARLEAAQRGAAAGTASLLIDLAFGGAPMVLGFVAASAGIPAAFAVAGLVAASGATASLLLARTARAPV
jgi:MFS family permease